MVLSVTRSFTRPSRALPLSLFAFAILFYNLVKFNGTVTRNIVQFLSPKEESWVCKNVTWAQANCSTQSRDNGDNHKDTVVVYSGPTVLANRLLNPSTGLPREALYLANFDYFLDNGVCGSPATSGHDTVLVVTAPVKARYARRLSELQEVCRRRFGQAVYVLEREDRCYDMESVRIALRQRGGGPSASASTSTSTSASSVDLSRYDFFVYVNCGMAGPYLPRRQGAPWTRNFTSLLSDSVKMAGLSINCVPRPHVQSFVYALDRTGLAIVNASGAVYDCGDGPVRKAKLLEIVYRYEIGMSQAVMRAGYEIASFMPRFTIGNVTGMAHPKLPNICNGDLWFEDKMRDHFNRIPKWEEFIFFKVSRFIPDEIREVYAAHYRGNFGS